MILEVGQIIRTPKQGGGFRVWQVTAVLLGGTGQEDVIEVETLDLKPTEYGRLLIPTEMFAVGGVVG